MGLGEGECLNGGFVQRDSAVLKGDGTDTCTEDFQIVMILKTWETWRRNLL